MPRYKHDCEHCKALGEFGEFDLYYCDKAASEPLQTVVARFGDEGHEYTSGLAFVGYDNAITEAHKRAVANGYLKL